MEAASLGWTIAGVLATVVIALIGAIFHLQNEFAQRNERKWDRAIKLAGIIADEGTPEVVRDVARLGLEDVGIELRERADEKAPSPLRVIVDAFEPQPSPDKVEAIRQAAEMPVPAGGAASIDPDIVLVAGLMKRAWEVVLKVVFLPRFESNVRPEDDTRIRIAFILVFFGACFLALSVGAVRSAIL